MTILWDELSALKLREASYHCPFNFRGSRFTTKVKSCGDEVGPDEEDRPSSSSPCYFRATASDQIPVFVAHYQLPSTVESAALSYLERYLASLPGSLREDNRIVVLALLTSIFLAVKMECASAYLPVSDLIRIFQVQSVIGTDDILKMELHLLKTLQWKVNPPLPQQYVHLFFQLLPTDTYFGSSPCLKQALEDRALAHILQAYRDANPCAVVHRQPCYQVSLAVVADTLESVGMSYARDALVDIVRDVPRSPGKKCWELLQETSKIID
jgi:hypothetical protein